MSEDLIQNQDHDPTLYVREELLHLGLEDARTNSPVNIFDIQADPPLSRISPAALDQLEPGHYTFEGSILDPVDGSDGSIKHGFGDTFGPSGVSIFKYAIDIEDRNGDKVVSRDIFGDHESYQIDDVLHPTMERLGFYFESGKTFVPTPETFKRRAAEFGVDVVLLPDATLIDPLRYLKAYSEGKYPVGTASEGYYQHDISDDHITGVIYGGPVLRQEIMDVLQPMFDSEGISQASQEKLGEMAFNLDEFTNSLRNFVMDLQAPRDYEIEGFNISNAQRLTTIGLRFGFGEQQIQAIMQAASERVSIFG